jgi:hypothetical protein
MFKQEADFLNKISVYWLNEHGYFDRSKSGGIEWKQQGNDISIETNMDQEYLRIHYWKGGMFKEEKEEVDYKVPLLTTECNFGGERYWFECPIYTNGNYCGRRVGVLYLGSKYFACRHCYDLTYSSKNRSYDNPAFDVIELSIEAEKLAEKITTPFYDGKPTRKYKKLLELNKKIHSYDLDSITGY